MSKRQVVVAVGTLFTAGALVLSGCGGGGGSKRLTKAEYTKQANKVCAKWNTAAKSLGQPKSLADVDRWVKKAAPMLKTELSDLRKLQPPASEEKDVNAWLATGDAQLKLIKQLSAASKANDMTKFLKIANDGQKSSKAGDLLTKKLGLTECQK